MSYTRAAPVSSSCAAFASRVCQRPSSAARVLSRRAQRPSKFQQRSAFTTRAVIEVNESNWEDEVIKSDKMVLVDYWATWCGPCKLVAPMMDWVEKECPDLKVVKVETDPNPSLVEKYKVYGLPTLMLFKDGEVVPGSHHEGAIAKKSLQAYLEENGVTMSTTA
eukprot:CAMPEP_0117667510 /NCGR_PEP_ID=MMETSP0804-20121206/11013_1 /TAXON_ID=1074897 /ORGANISM="Tetraselmis astigmatica, Strain CCMP880" /LENGTH=163 /DNA_ID=CAMNT_0005475257 /DNA_START=226 /DNA_END=717 /DNA_ORIENTATION=+